MIDHRGESGKGFFPISRISIRTLVPEALDLFLSLRIRGFCGASCCEIPQRFKSFLVRRSLVQILRSFFPQLRKQERHVSLFTAVPIFFYLPLLLALCDFRDAKERFPDPDRPILEVRRSEGGGGKPPGFDRAYRTRALSPSCATDRPSKSLSICSFVLSIDPCGTPFLQFLAREIAPPLEKRCAIAKTREETERPDGDRPMRRYAVRSTGLLKARSKA